MLRLGRRHTLTGLFFLVNSGWRAKAQPVASGLVHLQLDDQEIQALGSERGRVKVSSDHSKTAEDMKVGAPTDRAVPVIFIVVGILSIPVIWRVLRSMFLQVYYGGVIIDTRATPVSIVHDHAIPSGTVLVIASDGTAQRFDEKDFSEDALASLLAKKE